MENKDVDEYSSSWFGKGDLLRKFDEIKELIGEYGLDHKLFDNAVEKIYNELMKTKEFKLAASLAKKHGL